MMMKCCTVKLSSPSRMVLRTDGTFIWSASGPNSSTAAFSAIRIRPSEATICIGTLSTKPAKHGAFHRHARDRQSDHRQDHRQRVAACDVDKKYVADISADHEQDAMGEVENFHNPENQHQPERNQDIDRAHHGAVGDLFDERGEGTSIQRLACRRNSDFMSAGKSILRVPSLHHWVI